MKKPAVFICTAAAIGLALFAWWFYDNKPSPDVVKEISAKPAAQKAKEPASSAAVKQQDLPAELNQEPDPYESEAFKAQIQQVADLYEESSKYPINSQPVFDSSAVAEPEPFEFTEVDLPFPEKAGDDTPLRLAAATDTYQYFQGDVLQARLQVMGAEKQAFVSVDAILSGANGDIPLPLNFHPINDNPFVLGAQLDTKLVPPNLLTTEMQVKLTVTVDERELFTSVAFRYAVPSAQIVGAQPSYVNGANLVVPLQVNVGQSGYYFVRAIMDDATTGQPLIELQNEGRLQAGNGILSLHAHASALKRQGSEGPYLLRSFKLYRGAEAQEQFDSPGSSLQPQIAIQGHPFSSYSNDAHVDKQAQERITFLRDLGALGNDQEQ